MNHQSTFGIRKFFGILLFALLCAIEIQRLHGSVINAENNIGVSVVSYFELLAYNTEKTS